MQLMQDALIATVTLLDSVNPETNQLISSKMIQLLKCKLNSSKIPPIIAQTQDSQTPDKYHLDSQANRSQYFTQ